MGLKLLYCCALSNETGKPFRLADLFTASGLDYVNGHLVALRALDVVQITANKEMLVVTHMDNFLREAVKKEIYKRAAEHDSKMQQPPLPNLLWKPEILDIEKHFA